MWYNNYSKGKVVGNMTSRNKTSIKTKNTKGKYLIIPKKYAHKLSRATDKRFCAEDWN